MSTHYTQYDPTPNIPMLRKIWEWVKEQHAIDQSPGTGWGNWEQGSWVCMTQIELKSTMTEEKWLEYLDMDFDDQHEVWLSAVNSLQCHTSFCIAGYAAHMTPGVFWVSDDSVIVNGGTVTRSVDGWAEQELGLTDEEAGDLFEGSNEFADVEAILKEIFARAGETLE